MDEEILWPAISTILGAFIASFTSWLVHRDARERDRKRVESVERAAAIAAAQLLIIEAVNIANGFATFKKHYDECLEDAAAKGVDQPAALIIALADMPDSHISHEKEGLSLLISIGRISIFERIQVSRMRYLALIGGMRAYGREREKLNSLLQQADSVSGDGQGRLAVEAAGAAAHIIEAQFASLNRMVAHMVEACDADFVEAKEKLKELIEAFKAEYGADFRVSEVSFVN